MCKKEIAEVKEKEIDRVGDVGQKELALDKAGLKRVEVYRRIKEMLDAVTVEETLEDGMVVKTEVPNMVMRAKGVELALKAFGDLKEFDKAGVVNNFTFANMVKVAMTHVHNNISVDTPSDNAVFPDNRITE